MKQNILSPKYSNNDADNCPALTSFQARARTADAFRARVPTSLLPPDMFSLANCWDIDDRPTSELPTAVEVENPPVNPCLSTARELIGITPIEPSVANFLSGGCCIKLSVLALRLPGLISKELEQPMRRKKLDLNNSI